MADTEASLLRLYLGWPLVVPWYALRTRGRAGWWLAVQLYGVALGGVLGFLWGALLRAVVLMVVGVPQ